MRIKEKKRERERLQYYNKKLKASVKSERYMKTERNNNTNRFYTVMLQLHCCQNLVPKTLL